MAYTRVDRRYIAGDGYASLRCSAWQQQHLARRAARQRRQPRRTFQVVSLRRLPEVSSFTASRICCSKSSITSSISSHPSGAVLFFSLRSSGLGAERCERQRQRQRGSGGGSLGSAPRGAAPCVAQPSLPPCASRPRVKAAPARRGRKTGLAAGKSVSTSGVRRRHPPPPEGGHRCCWRAREVRSAWSDVPPPMRGGALDAPPLQCCYESLSDEVASLQPKPT